MGYIVPAPATPVTGEYAAPVPVLSTLRMLLLWTALAVDAAPAPVSEYLSRAPGVYAASGLVGEYIPSASCEYAAPVPARDYTTLAPAVEAAPALVGEYISPVSSEYGAAASVVYIAPAMAVYAAPTPMVGPILPAPGYISPVPNTCRRAHVACTGWVRGACSCR